VLDVSRLQVPNDAPIGKIAVDAVTTNSMHGLTLGAPVQVVVAVISPSLLIVYGLVWGADALSPVFGRAQSMALLVFVNIAGILIQELLHALGYWWIGRVPRRAIRFGFARFMIVAIPRRPLSVRALRWSVALPGLLVGAVPYALALASGHPFLAASAAFMVGFAGGDAAFLWNMRRLTNEQQVQISARLGRLQECR
jgi:hypothetical protein